MGVSYDSKAEAHAAAFFMALRVPFKYTSGVGFYLPETYSEKGQGVDWGAKVELLPAAAYCPDCGTTWTGYMALCPKCSSGNHDKFTRPINLAVKYAQAATIDFSYHDAGAEPTLEPIPMPVASVEAVPDPVDPGPLSLGHALERVLSETDYTITLSKAK